MFPDDRYRIFSRLAQSRSGALGTSPVLSFGDDNDVDLKENAGHGDGLYEHALQFYSNIVDQERYWDLVIRDMELDCIPQP